MNRPVGRVLGTIPESQCRRGTASSLLGGKSIALPLLTLSCGWELPGKQLMHRVEMMPAIRLTICWYGQLYFSVREPPSMLQFTSVGIFLASHE